MVDNQRLKVSAALPICDSRATHARGPVTQRGVLMKFRMFRLFTTVAMLAVLVEALGAGAKWG
jgi:hypothetical protein